jgi:undecaprenyl-diphosphatase
MATQEAEPRINRTARPSAAPDASTKTPDATANPRDETRDHAPAGWAWPVLATIGLVGFAIMTWLVVSKFVFPFDQPLLDAGAGLGQYMVAWRDLSDSANLPLIAIGVAIVLFLLVRKQRAEALVVIGILAAITAGSEAVKELVARPRPPGFVNNELGVVYSYPSGHVLEALTIYGIIAVLLWRSSAPKVIRVVVPILFAIVVVMVAIARVAVGAHYPSDVLAGALAGIGALAIFALLSGALARRRAAKSS